MQLRESISTPYHLKQPQQQSVSLGQCHSSDDSYHDFIIGDLSNSERHIHHPSDVCRSVAHCSEQHSGHQLLPLKLLTHIAFQTGSPPSRLSGSSEFKRPRLLLADGFRAPPPIESPDPSGIIEKAGFKSRMCRHIAGLIRKE